MIAQNSSEHNVFVEARRFLDDNRVLNSWYTEHWYNLKQETTFNIENETLSNQAHLNSQFETRNNI